MAKGDAPFYLVIIFQKSNIGTVQDSLFGDLCVPRPNLLNNVYGNKVQFYGQEQS